MTPAGISFRRTVDANNLYTLLTYHWQLPVFQARYLRISRFPGPWQSQNEVIIPTGVTFSRPRFRKFKLHCELLIFRGIISEMVSLLIGFLARRARYPSENLSHWTCSLTSQHGAKNFSPIMRRKARKEGKAKEGKGMECIWKRERECAASEAGKEEREGRRGEGRKGGNLFPYSSR